MDEGSSRRIRNIGILAHVDAGKTSITERLLHVAGVRLEAGDVDDGTTATDYLAVERSHGITIKAAAVRFDWGGLRIHLIDTPGHVDFGTEVERALRVLDGAVIALCAVSGVQARTEAVVRASARRGLARICFVNKMDRRGADFARVVEDLGSSLEPAVLPIHYPVFSGGAFSGVVDLLRMRFHPADGGDPSGTLGVPGIPEDIAVRCDEARAAIQEALADQDSSVMEDFIAGRRTGDASLIAALRAATLKGRAVPALCGTAFSDSAGSLLLGAVADFLPSPEEAGCPEGVDPRSGEPVRRAADRAEPFSAFVFKTSVGAGAVGGAAGLSGTAAGFSGPSGPSGTAESSFSWARVWSGSIRVGDRVLDARSGKFVKAARIFGIHADRMEPEEEAGTGEIAAFALIPAQGQLPRGMPRARIDAEPYGSGASLCEPEAPISYEPLAVPEAVVSLVLEPAGSGEIARLRDALAALASGDAALRVSEDRETGRFEIAGLGELHLDVAVERLAREYGVRVRSGQPRVSCKEAPMRAAQGEEDFDRDFGGERIRARVAVSVVPLAPRGEGEGVVEPEIAMAEGLRASSPYVQAVLRGAAGALSAGPSEGWPLVALRVTITALVPPQGAGRNAETAVEAACALAVRKALLGAGTKILEPVMRLDVEAPEESFGAVLAELTARQARIEAVDDAPGGKDIVAMAPLRRIFGLAGALRSVSAGRAGFQARFGRYEPARP